MNRWHKSSYSQNGGQCVEVSEGAVTAVRDTQHRDRGTLEFAAAEWGRFIQGIKADEL
ncbi:DUF397 domain-containing protein [Nocardiopsis sediminis]|uniref:DUF397 domain-containing protein n=1 Tax=Nocardiopsis sediminis TaxID=1778267 RepID=A0ABV8FFZ8_9ACTN